VEHPPRYSDWPPSATFTRFADVTEQPLVMGHKVDAAGLRVQTSVLVGTIHGQYVYEGLMAGALFTFGSVGFIALSVAGNIGGNGGSGSDMVPARRRRCMMVGLGIVWCGFLGSRWFMSLKMPNYLSTSA